MDEYPDGEETEEREDERVGQQAKGSAEEQKEEDGRGEAVLGVAEAEGESSTGDGDRKKYEGEGEQFEEADLSVAEGDAVGGAAEEEQREEDGAGGVERVDAAQDEQDEEGEEAVADDPDLEGTWEGQGSEGKKCEVEDVEVVGDLGQEDEVAGVVEEELAVRVDVLEGEVRCGPLEVFAAAEGVADASGEGSQGGKGEGEVCPEKPAMLRGGSVWTSAQ
jgi:hypothetical protein